MRLIECYIENYGNLSKQRFPFSEGLNNLCEGNGYGKSTLVSFIKAMFYGLPTHRANAKDFDDRVHYYPFNGGKFGGSLTFSMGGHAYRIERFFDKTSEKKDTLTIYRDHIVTDEFDRYAGEIGRAVFGVDEDSLTRTIFITSDAIELEATTSIGAKLNHLVDATDEAETYESAVKHIEETRKRLKASRGDNDEMSRVKARIAELESDIRNRRDISEALGDKYEALNRLQGEIRKKEAYYAQCAEAGKIAAQWVTYDNLVALASERAAQLQAIRDEYPHGLPTEEELTELENAITLCQKHTEDLSRATLTDEEQEKLSSLEVRFPDGVPSEEDLRELDDLHRRYTAVAGDATADAPEKSEQLLSLEQRFAAGVPSEETLAAYDSDLLRLQEINALLNAEATAAMPIRSPGSARRLPYLIAAALSLLLTVGGGISFLYSTALGVALLVAGGIGLFTTGFLYLLKNQANSAASMPSRDPARIAEQALLNDKLRSFLASYRYTCAAGVETDYANLKNDLATYKTEQERYEQACAAYQNRQTLCQELRRALEGALVIYGITGDPYEGVRVLHHEINEYKRLLQVRDKQAEARAIAIRGIKEANETIRTILARYRIPYTSAHKELLDSLKERRDALVRLEQEHTAQTERAEAYRIANGLTERPSAQDADTDLNKLKSTLETLRDRRAQILREIESDEHEVEPLDERIAELEMQKERLSAIKQRIYLLDAAKEALERAEAALMERYVKPVKDIFLRYAAPLERVLGERMHMDRNFSITFERDGEYRSYRHLSAGQRSLCALCFRLALIENMYREEMPFIIMDDPFVHLDADHLEKALALIRELSDGRQLLYLTCHEGRNAVYTA